MLLFDLSGVDSSLRNILHFKQLIGFVMLVLLRALQASQSRRLVEVENRRYLIIFLGLSILFHPFDTFFPFKQLKDRLFLSSSEFHARWTQRTSCRTKGKCSFCFCVAHVLSSHTQEHSFYAPNHMPTIFAPSPSVARPRRHRAAIGAPDGRLTLFLSFSGVVASACSFYKYKASKGGRRGTVGGGHCVGKIKIGFFSAFSFLPWDFLFVFFL